MGAQAEATESCLQATRSIDASSVSCIAEVGMSSVGERLRRREWRGIDEDDPTECSSTVADSFGSLDDLDLPSSRVVYFGGMVGSPALTLQAHTIVDEQNAIAVHPLNHRLRDGSTALDGAHSRDCLQETGDGFFVLSL